VIRATTTHLGDEGRGRDVTEDGHGRPPARTGTADRRRHTWSETGWEEPSPCRAG
jgi:hypothetical protein